MARSKKTTSGQSGPEEAPALQDSTMAPHDAQEPEAESASAVPLEEPGRDRSDRPAEIAGDRPDEQPSPDRDVTPEADVAPVLVQDGRPEPAVSPPPPPPPPASGGSGFLGGLLGGALATAGGFSLLWVLFPDLLQGREAVSLTPLEEAVAAQEGRSDGIAAELAALRAELDTLRDVPAPGAVDAEALGRLESALGERIDTMASRIEEVSASLDVLDGRVAQVEARPPVVEGGDAEAAAGAAIAEMRAALDAQRAEMTALAEEARDRIAAAEAQAAALQSEAAEAARAAVARAALSRLQAAMDAGSPFAGALSDLAGATEAPIPEALVSAADTGVATIAELQRTFPPAAREALTAAIRAEVGDGATAIQRLGAFLRAQTGARSITPREGDSADAVLSRAEAAVSEGRLADALALLATLPEPAQAALADWRARAETRLAAVQAAEALSAGLSES